MKKIDDENDFMLLRLNFKRDEPFTDDGTRCFINPGTLEIVWSESYDDESLKTLRGKKNLIEAPLISHHEWHEAFMDFLDEYNVSSYYTTSIGLTLKHLDKDENLRYLRFDWQEFKTNYASKKCVQWLNEIGVEVDSEVCW